MAISFRRQVVVSFVLVIAVAGGLPTLVGAYWAGERPAVLAIVGAACLAVLVAAAVAYFVSRGFLRYLRKLGAASAEIWGGNFNYRLEATATDEFGDLERAFNCMAAAICERDRQIREHAEAQMVRSARLASVGTLAASIAHEVNNPLTGIIVYLRLVQRCLAERSFPQDRLPEIMKWLQAMEGEATRCGRLIAGMLQLGREPVMRVAAHQVNEILEKSILLLEHRFALDNVKVERQMGADLPPVECDDEQIQQTLMGLLINAFEAMPRGGTITIGSRLIAAANGVELFVRDTGVGIAPENLAKIFDGFFTTKQENKGLGLGLSIAQAIVRRHHGEIKAVSQLGQGATFMVCLPLHQNAAELAAANPRATA